MLKDMFGNEVHAGDYVIYAVKGCKYGDPLRMGLIFKVTETGYLNYKKEKIVRHKMTIKLMKRSWDNKTGRVIKSVIDTSRHLIRISDADAEEFKKRGLVP